MTSNDATGFLYTVHKGDSIGGAGAHRRLLASLRATAFMLCIRAQLWSGR